MRKFKLFLSLLMLFSICVGSVWADTYTLVLSVSDVTTGDKVILATKSSSNAPETGVTGLNTTTNKDAAVSTTESEWVQYDVTAVTDGWNLYDANAAKYIKSPGSSNQFVYDATSKGTCSVNSDGVLKCNNRYLVQNSSYYRMYTSIGTYVPFYVWKVTTGSGSDPVAVTGVSLNKASTSIEVGKTETLTATVEPSGATNKNVSWTSSNTSVATVDGGVVTAVAVGTANITVTTEDGSFSDVCAVTVTAAAPKITITQSSSGVSGSSYGNNTFTQESVSFSYSQWMKSNSLIQAKASTTGSLKNTTAIPGIIKSITVVTGEGKTARAVTVKGGATADNLSAITAPATSMSMTFDFGENEYYFFELSTPGNACYFDKIIIEYETCTELALTNNAISLSSPAGQRSITVNWANETTVSDVDHYELSYKVKGAEGDPTVINNIANNVHSYAVTGLACSTTYEFVLTAKGNEHCDFVSDVLEGTTANALTLPVLSYTATLSTSDANVTPTWASTPSHDGEVTYTSSAPSVLQIVDAATGEAKPVGAGSATITATYAATATNCEASQTSNAVTVTGDVSVSFNANGGSGTMTNQTITVSTPTNLKANTFEAPSTCQYFYGWATSKALADAQTRAYEDEEEVTISAGMELFAIWKTYNYAVTKGTGTGAATFTLSADNADCGGSITVTATPNDSHKGNPQVSITPSNAATVNGTTISNITAAITAVNVTFEAKESYNITWNVNGADLTGDALNGVSTSVLEGSAIENLPIVADNTLACTNKFMGWSRNGANPTVPKTASDYNDLFTDGANAGEINADVKFYAVFAKVSGSGAAVGTLLFNEEFSGLSANNVPTGPTSGATTYGQTLTYTCTDGGSATKIYNETLASGSAPELLVGKSTGSFAISGISTGGAKSLTLTYQANNNNMSISASSGITVGEISYNSTSKQASCTLTIGNEYSSTNFDLTFSNSASGNTRLDNIHIVVAESVTASNYVTQCAAVAAPTFSVAAGTYNEAQSVELSCETEEAEIRYTINGDAPTSSSTLYEGAIAVNQSMTIKAIAIKNAVESDVNSAAYELQVVDPTISGEANFMESTTVTLACTDANAQIRYTIDGNDPDGESTLYTESFELNATATVKAIAVKAGWTSSEIVSKAFSKIQVLTVAEARDIIDNGTTEEKTGVYAHGIVSQIVTAYNSQYGNITYDISVDGETSSDQLRVYRGKGVEGANFTSANDIMVGDEVVVKGNLTKYNNTNYQFAEGTGWLVSRKQRVLEIALSGEYTTEFNENAEFSYEGMVVTATYNYGDAANVTDVATWSEPDMTTAGEKTVTVSYTFDGKTVTKDYTITVVHDCQAPVTISAGETQNGTFALSATEACGDGDGATVNVTDIDPEEGYRFSEITATNGDVDNDNKQVTGITENTTITVVFEQIPSYDVTWNVNGETSTTQVQEGSKPTFPATPTSCETGENASTTFIGWATAAWTGKAADLNDEKLENITIYTSANDMPDVDADVTYYAVFAKEVSAGGAAGYRLSDAAPVIADETVIIATKSEEKYYAVGTDKSAHEITLSSGVISSTDNMIWTLEVATTGLYYKSGSNYIHLNSSNYNVTTSTTNGDISCVSNNDGSFKFKGNSNDRYLTYGTSYGVTSNADNATPVYVFKYSAGSAAEYADYMTTCCEKKAVTIDANIENGTVTADPTQACEGDKVTLTPSANPAYHFDAWNVYKTGDTETTVTVDAEAVNDVKVYSFTMPDYAVTVSATFKHDECTQLGTPQNVEVAADYKSAMLDWDDVVDADHYVVTIKKGEETVESNTVNVSEYEVAATLLANTTYTYEIQATANDALTHCPSVVASDDFDTDELPEATLTLSENGEEFEFEENQHKLNDVVTLPSALHFSGCTGKVLKGWSKVAVAEQDEEPTENYYAAGTQYTIGATADKLYAVFATEGAGQASTLFSETFDACNGTGANDDNGWSGSIASATLPNALSNSWAFVKGNAAYQCAKFGTGSAKGSAETPTIELTGAATLTFKAGAWSGTSEGTTLNVTATGAILDKGSVTMTKGAWTSYTVAITNANGSVKIKFEAKNASNNRFFLDDVVVSQSAISYSDYTTSCAAALDVPTFSLNPVVTPVEDEYQDTINVVIATAVEGATIYYTTNGNNPTTASTVYSEPITLNTCGEHTIKAFVKKDAQESAIATATYTLAIPVPASDETPFTPQKAIDVYNSGCYNNEQVHVKGVVTGASYNETLQNNAAAYNGSYNVFVKEIGDNSENPVTYEFYRMWKDNNNTAFTKGDIKAGDTITATGTMTKYQTTYEFNAGCYMESYVAYDEPKTDISNTVDNPYTVEVADGLIDNINSDLTKTVFVKGIVTSFPSSNKVIIRDTENGEEYLELYKSTLADGISALVIGDQIIVTGIMQKYNNQTYQMNEGCQVVWKKAKVVIEIAAMNMVVNDVATITPTSVTPEAAAEAITYSIKEGSEEYITLNGAQITATAAGTATIIATVETAETYIGTSIEFTVTVAAQADTRKTAQDLDGFDAISGNLNSEIAFASFKGDGTADPVRQDGGSILYYQPASGKAAGGYMTLSAVHGCKIDQVKVVTATHDTKIKYSKDGGELSEATDVTAGDEYLTPALLDAETVNIYCAGADKSHRLYIAQVVVYYTGEAAAVDHYTLVGVPEVAPEFPKNGEFNHDGITVWACYDANCEDKVDITAQCEFVANLSAEGTTAVSVQLNSVDVATYDITVISGQDDPALAWKRDEAVISEAEVIAAADVASWVAPTLRNELNVSPISFSSNKPAIATVDENGFIALAGGYGTATITATFEETEQYIASVATYTITVQEPLEKVGGNWVLADQADIKVGTRVIIAGTYQGVTKTMGAQNNANNRLAIVSTVTDGVLAPGNGTKVFTLVDAGNGKFAFQGRNGNYLSAAGTGTNNVLNEAADYAAANAQWTITIVENNVANVVASSNNRNAMQYNSGSALFACYEKTTSQKPVYLYVNQKVYEGSDDPENPAAPVTINTNVVEDEIVVSGNIVVTVDATNFEEPKSYIAQNGATIIVNNADEAKSIIADTTSTIEVSSQTTVNQTFSVAATMGGGVSGQIAGASNVTIAESTEAYFDITLGANATSSQWHAFAVPFPVDALNGIYDAATGAKLTNEVNYAIMDYHGDIRATGAYGWKKYRGILQPGVFYLMTVDGDTKTFRFKMSGLDLPNFTSLALQLYAASGAGQGTDTGWNGVANPTLEHGTVNQTVTVLNPATYTYEDHDAGSYNFVVGTPFFIQADAQAVEHGMEMGAVDDTKPYYAPKHVSENGIEKMKVFFGNDKYQDKLTISANEEALNEYEIGKDLIKMTMTKTPKVAQIFGNAYGTKLCRANLPLVNDAVSMDVDLYAPQAGEYTIATSAIEGYDVYLTREDAIIWNLSTSEYTGSFEKGNNAGYGIRIVKAPQVITGVEQSAVSDQQSAQKVIIDEHVYILRGEQLFDVNGKMVK